MEKKNYKTWLKRFGVAGFLFFLVKGLIWIGVAVAVAVGLMD